MEIEEIKKRLKAAEQINFSKHFDEPKVHIRGISKNEILNNLKNPEKLISFEDQGKSEKGHKFALLFSKSNKYDLKIAVSFKNMHINVITTHVQNIKRRKVFETWLKKLR